MSSGESKVPCSKEPYCIGTWNIRFMNQGKLDVVKQKMARVNINILGISKLKWTGMGEFNSGDHYIYYCGQKSLRRNGAGLVVNKRVQTAALGWILINGRMISVPFQFIGSNGSLFHSNIIHYHSNASICPKHYWKRCRSCPSSLKTYKTS